MRSRRIGHTIRTRRPPELDADEIKTAVAHQAAERASAEPPFVNRRDPARVLGPDGRPAVSRRAPIWAGVPGEKRNDWRRQPSHRVHDPEKSGQTLNLTDGPREGPAAQ